MTSPRCARPMRHYELPGLPVLEDPSCGRPEGHHGPCRSPAAMARHAAAQAYRTAGRQAPSGAAVIAAAIAEGRRRAGLSQRRLAVVVGVTEASVQHYENARRTPSARTWIQLELALGPLGVVREAGRRAEAGDGQRRGDEADAA